MRVWLAAFVLLFAAVELFEWVAQMDSWQPTGVWLVLGGMGLATLSNATHLPKLETGLETKLEASADSDEPLAGSKPIDARQKDAKQKATGSGPVAKVSAAQGEKAAPPAADESDQDSISFKVRPLKR